MAPTLSGVHPHHFQGAPFN